MFLLRCSSILFVILWTLSAYATAASAPISTKESLLILHIQTFNKSFSDGKFEAIYDLLSKNIAEATDRKEYIQNLKTFYSGKYHIKGTGPQYYKTRTDRAFSLSIITMKIKDSGLIKFCIKHSWTWLNDNWYITDFINGECAWIYENLQK